MLGVVTHASNLSTQEAEMGGLPHIQSPEELQEGILKINK